MKGVSDKQQTVFVVVFLVISTLAVYWQVRGHDFIGFDDNYYVTDNKNVQSGLSWQGVKWAFTTTHAWNWHPLTWLSHMLDCQLFGLNPAGHHLTSVFFHTANAVLLFLVLKCMSSSLWCSGFVAAAFALHPLHIESVAWVSERKDVLSTFFWLLTMLAYMRYAKRPSFSKYVLVVLFFVLGLMAKQMLVTLPFVLLLLDYWPLGRFEQTGKKQAVRESGTGTVSFSRCIVEKLPLLVLSVVAGLIVFLVQLKATLVKSTIAIPINYRIGNAIVSYAGYIIKMFWPIKLGILYPHPGTNLPLWQIFAGSLLLLGICVVAIRSYRSRQWFIVGWLWYLGTLVPVIGLVQVGMQAMADRYTYMTLTGLFIIVAWGAAAFAGKRKYGSIFLVAGAVTSLSVLTVLTLLQLPQWRNSIRLYKHTVNVTADNDIMHYNLGVLLYREGKIAQAMTHWREALKIDPGQSPIHKNLGVLLAQQGKPDEAISHFRQSLSINPNMIDVRYNIAYILTKQGKIDQAVEEYREILRINPNHADARQALKALLKNAE